MRTSLVQLGLKGLHNHQTIQVRKKQAWGRIFGGTCVVGPSPTSAPTSSSSVFASVVCELSVYYLDSDNVTAYDDEIGIFL